MTKKPHDISAEYWPLIAHTYMTLSLIESGVLSPDCLLPMNVHTVEYIMGPGCHFSADIIDKFLELLDEYSAEQGRKQTWLM